jgi:hypothetical protein
VEGDSCTALRTAEIHVLFMVVRGARMELKATYTRKVGVKASYTERSRGETDDVFYAQIRGGPVWGSSGEVAGVQEQVRRWRC